MRWLPTVKYGFLVGLCCASLAGCGGSSGGSTSTGGTTEPIPPGPVADSYSAFGNLLLQVGPGEGVLANDKDAVSVTPGTLSTDLGGTVTLAEDGSFTYRLAKVVNLGQTDLFHYTSRSSTGDTAQGDVQVKLLGNGYFVDPRQTSAGSGTEADPFPVVASVPALSQYKVVFVRVGDRTVQHVVPPAFTTSGTGGPFVDDAGVTKLLGCSNDFTLSNSFLGRFSSELSPDSTASSADQVKSTFVNPPSTDFVDGLGIASGSSLPVVQIDASASESAFVIENFGALVNAPGADLADGLHSFFYCSFVNDGAKTAAASGILVEPATKFQVLVVRHCTFSHLSTGIACGSGLTGSMAGLASGVYIDSATVDHDLGDFPASVLFMVSNAPAPVKITNVTVTNSLAARSVAVGTLTATAPLSVEIDGLASPGSGIILGGFSGDVSVKNSVMSSCTVDNVSDSQNMNVTLAANTVTGDVNLAQNLTTPQVAFMLVKQLSQLTAVNTIGGSVNLNSTTAIVESP